MHLSRWLPTTLLSEYSFLGKFAQPIVTDAVSNVTFIGSSSDGVEQFESIFFGQDTGGTNRFAPPVPYRYAAGSVVAANISGAACPQPITPVAGFEFLFSNVTNQSENCLSLRIARPAGTRRTARLPVMVWVFGGEPAIELNP
jgi:carboxylesterase type B